MAADKTDTAHQPISNVHVARVESLVSPVDLHTQMKISEKVFETVTEGRTAIENILKGEDDRLLVIVGPCSIHDEKAALEYAEKLAALRDRVSDRLEIVMRAYFEKPRTTLGWKGLINDPHLNGSFDIQTGLTIARRLLIGINELGLPVGTEMLDPITPQYIDDLVAWTAIGARTTESQTHRQMASGLSTPVGFKNSTTGDLQVAIDAMLSARSPHAFLGIDAKGSAAVIQTAGNPWGHVILRGGGGNSNFHPEAIDHAVESLSAAGVCDAIMVDCSHANSGKKHENQQIAWKSVIEQRAAGNHKLVGMMLESHLVAGNQKLGNHPAQLTYGQSITDACIGWEETDQLITWAHDRLGA